MAVEDFGYVAIAANSSFQWFIHGFTTAQAVSFSIVVLPGSGDGVPYPLGHATLTQGEAWQHVDGTQAYKVYIQNNASFNSCSVRLLAQVDSL
jgi:hypothetical protein